ncbi:MAG: IS5 family transposase [Verrucomicrobiota bacterium]
MSGLKNQVKEFRIASNDFAHTGGRAAATGEHLNALWNLLRNGCAWRALPSEFGPWPAIHQFFNRLSKDGYFEFLEDLFISGHAAESVFMDSTHFKVHQHSNGPESPEDQAIGKSRGGLNTKIHLLVDVLGQLTAPIVVTSGNVSDIAVAPVLLEDVEDTAVVGDKGYDSRELRDTLRGQDCEPCLPARSNVENPEPYDVVLYREGMPWENVFHRLKVFRRLASRSEKTKRMFFAFICCVLAAIYTTDKLW